MAGLDSIVRQARDGPDRDAAFAEIVRRFQDMAVGSAYATVGDWQTAQDIAQEAFLEAWLHLARLADPAAFPGWFRRIVIGKCGRELRRPRARAALLSEARNAPSGDVSADAALEAAEQRDLVACVLSHLDPDDRMVVVLHYVAGHSYADVGGFLGIPSTTVDHRLRRARGAMQDAARVTVARRLRARRPSSSGGFVMTVRFVTRHPETLRALSDARRIAEGDAPVLIVGEPGTGKVVVARHVCECSPQRDGPFVLTSGTDTDAFEEQLFGGSGLTPKVEEADGGSLVVDFGRPLSAALQTRLLELIRNGAYYDAAAGEERRADVRIMALTNMNLEDEAREGRFDARLLECFAESTVRVAPLRERPGDIPLLTDHFLDTRTPHGRATPVFAPEALETLMRHSWPGNVRGLMEAVDHALHACEGATILPDHLPASVAMAQ
jgi:RNA polymerase sigma factor (sigma-70 family)